MVDTTWINTKLGACPNCGEINEDKLKLALEPVKSGAAIGSGGLATPIGLGELAKQFRDWPEPILSGEQIVSENPLQVECRECGNTYSPE